VSNIFEEEIHIERVWKQLCDIEVTCKNIEENAFIDEKELSKYLFYIFLR